MATGNKVVSGARAQMYANGQKVGIATGFDVTDNIRQEPNRVLDKLEPDGFCSVSREVSVSFSQLRVPYRSIVSMGMFPESADDESIRKASVLDFPEILFIVYDSKTGAKLCSVKGAVPAQRQLRFQPNTVTVENGTFPALYVSDEATAEA